MIIRRDLIESQKLYSTGDDDLDELLEKAFCDGYEYAQREFASKKKSSPSLNFMKTKGNKKLNKELERGRITTDAQSLGFLFSGPGKDGRYPGKVASDRYRYEEINPIAAQRVKNQTGKNPLDDSSGWGSYGLVMRRKRRN